MTLSTAGYTVTGNEPLNHARILYAPITGTVTAGGTDGALAANDYTFQRWELEAGENTWTQSGAGAIDTVFIAAHSLGGNTIRAQYQGASATNLLTYTEQFDNAAWSKVNTTVTANTAVAPDGTISADTVAFNGTIEARVEQGASVATQATFSIWMRVASGTASVSIGTRASNAVTVTVTDAWQRFSMTASDSAFPRVRCDTATSVFIWGAQLQTGALTSYIKTEASTVTSDWHDITSWVPILDNSTIAIMGNDSLGQPFQTSGFRVVVSNAVGIESVGIIRAGVALQMQRPVFGGVQPIGLSRIVETRHAMSETGQWLGRVIQRQARRTSMNWMHLTAAWYRSDFEPFSLSLPQTPFGLIQNPLRMPESVAWCWTDETPAPENMGIRDLMSVSLGITGYLE